MSDVLSVRVDNIRAAAEVLRLYYKTVRATPKIRLPGYAKNHIYNNICSEMNEDDKDIISRWEPTPSQNDDMYYVDYYWLPLLSMNEMEFLRLKIDQELGDKELYRYFPFSRRTYANWLKRILQYFVDFENGKIVKKQYNRRYMLK